MHGQKIIKTILCQDLQGKSHNVVVRFDIRTAVNIKMALCRNVSPCNFVDKHRRFRGTYHPPN